MAPLKHVIAQQKPFSSTEEEALLNLMRTSRLHQRAFLRRIRHWGITHTQYNVPPNSARSGPRGPHLHRDR